MLRKIPLTTALMALFAVGVLLGAACSDDDDDAGAQDGVSQEDFTALETQVSRNNVFAGLVGLSAVPFHELDENIQTASDIPEDYAFEVEHAQEVNSAIIWPDELTELAAPFETALDEFAAAIEDDDLEAAKAAATETHDSLHELEHEAWAYAAGEEHEEGDEHEEEATETPGG